MRLFLLVLLASGIAFAIGRSGRSASAGHVTAATPHEAYAERLQRAGLDRAALGRFWARAGERALAEAPLVDAPLRETGYLDPREPDAVGYRFSARAGRRLRVALDLDPPTNALVFMDLFRVPADTARPLERVASADSAARVLEYEPSRDGEFVIRIQPELLRGGRYTLTATVTPTLAFPVDGGGVGSVRSFFGDPRDGGARDHHGIDIFARRGTPVLATSFARVSRVRTTPVGGRVVWLRDESGNSVYYAHLEEQLVRSGQSVAPGDTLGLVGNSGNARTTPPHLHFGIYRRGRGPMDPLPFVEPAPGPPRPPALPLTDLGRWRRVAAADARLRAAPTGEAAVVATMDAGVPVRVLAVAGDWYRVRLPDGRQGFVAGRLTEPPLTIRRDPVADGAAIRERPHSASARIAALPPGDTVDVLGRFGDFLLVRASGREAWLDAPVGN